MAGSEGLVTKLAESRLDDEELKARLQEDAAKLAGKHTEEHKDAAGKEVKHEKHDKEEKKEKKDKKEKKKDKIKSEDDESAGSEGSGDEESKKKKKEDKERKKTEKKEKKQKDKEEKENDPKYLHEKLEKIAKKMEKLQEKKSKLEQKLASGKTSQTPTNSEEKHREGTKDTEKNHIETSSVGTATGSGVIA